MWYPCERCDYWFEPDNVKKNYKVLQYKGACVGVICPYCSGTIQVPKEEKKETH